jgi:hypothetical protein
MSHFPLPSVPDEILMQCCIKMDVLEKPADECVNELFDKCGHINEKTVQKLDSDGNFVFDSNGNAELETVKAMKHPGQMYRAILAELYKRSQNADSDIPALADRYSYAVRKVVLGAKPKKGVAKTI